MWSLFIATLLACPAEDSIDDSIEACLETYSAEAGYDFVSDMWHISCAQPLEGEPVDCPPPTIEDLEAECEDAGHPCADTITVTHDAAVCIAEADGLEEGLEGLYADLIYNHGLDRPIWAVSNVLSSEGAEASGSSLAIDAATGEVLERSQWERMP